MDNYIFSKNTIEFVTVGVEFCALMEKVQESEKCEFIDTTVKILPLLYLKAILLPDSNEENEEYDINIEHFVTEEIYEYIRNSIEQILGEQDSYLEVFHEDLTDIYQDIKDFISVYSLGNEECMRVSLNECKNNFMDYWGQKLVNVLRALHSLKYSSEESEDIETHHHDNIKPTNGNNLFSQRQESWKEDMNMDEWNKWNE